MIVVAGEALFDLVVDHHDCVRAHPGGGPFNTARTIARLGQPVSYLGRLSRDRFGTTLRRELANDGVRLDFVVETDQPTTLAIAELNPTGQAQYRFYADGTAAPGLTPQDAITAVATPIRVLHLGTLGLVLEPMAAALQAVVEAASADTVIVLDPNIRAWAIKDADAYRDRLDRVLSRSDIVKVSDDDLAWLNPGEPPPAAARSLMHHGVSVVLLTRGSHGTTIITPATDIDVPAVSVRVQDTIGAGDAFTGGFIAWWHAKNLDRSSLATPDHIIQATQFAAHVAARTCEQPGARPPSLDQLGDQGVALTRAHVNNGFSAPTRSLGR